LTLPDADKPAKDIDGKRSNAEANPKPNGRAQIFFVAAVGAGFIAAAAWFASIYAPNLIKPLSAKVSSLLGRSQNNRETSGASGTNRSLAKGIGTNQAGGASTAFPPSPPPDPWRGLTAGAIVLEKSNDNGLVYATGKLRNSSDHQRFGVKVVLDLFDEHDKKVGSATDYTQLIDPAKEWKFKAMVTERTSVRAVIASVTEK
jgi:hypothetical protein